MKIFGILRENEKKLFYAKKQIVIRVLTFFSDSLFRKTLKYFFRQNNGKFNVGK